MGFMDKVFAATPDKVQKWAVERNVAKLSSALTEKDPVVRRLAAEAMAQIRGAEVLDFCKQNAHASDDNLRWSITQILGLIGTAEAMSILSDVRDPATRVVRTKKPPTE